MPNRHSIDAKHQKPGAGPDRCQSPFRASLGALSFSHPCLAESAIPMPVDDTLVGALVVLCLAGGIAAGVLYRSMRRAEDALEQRVATAESELRTLLTMTDEAVLVLDKHAVVREANPGAEDIFGRKTHEIAGLKLSDLLPQSLALEELTRNGPAQFQTTAKRKGGTVTHVEVFLAPVHHTTQATYLALIHEHTGGGFGRTEDRRDDLAAPVNEFCHDLNNQLTGIIGNLSMILMKGNPEPAIRDRVLGAKKTALNAQELNRKIHELVTGDAGSAEVEPALTPAPVIPISPAKPPAEPSPGGRVLVLDDEEAICALISTALDSMGFQVTEATDVATAIRACEDSIKNGKPFDLVISDLSLDGDINGSDAVARLKTIDPKLKAIVSSGYDNDPIMSRYRDHGFCGAIAKPYEISKLNQVVREAIGDDEHRQTA